MGIQGLLPLLKQIEKPVHLAELKGEKVGVDAYVWLHRGAFSCALDLVLNQNDDEEDDSSSGCSSSCFQAVKKVVNYCVKKVKTLQASGIIPVIVFDGGG
jgi:exonuclease-1